MRLPVKQHRRISENKPYESFRNKAKQNRVIFYVIYSMSTDGYPCLLWNPLHQLKWMFDVGISLLCSHSWIRFVAMLMKLPNAIILIHVIGELIIYYCMNWSWSVSVLPENIGWELMDSHRAANFSVSNTRWGISTEGSELYNVFPLMTCGLV